MSRIHSGKLHYREQLDAIPCSCCGDPGAAHKGPVYLHQECHAGMGLTVRFTSPRQLTLLCYVCHLPVIRLGVVVDEKELEELEDARPPFSARYTNTRIELRDRSNKMIALPVRSQRTAAMSGETCE